MAKANKIEQFDANNAHDYARLQEQIKKSLQEIKRLQSDVNDGIVGANEALKKENETLKANQKLYRDNVDFAKTRNKYEADNLASMTSLERTLSGMPKAYESFTESLKENVSISDEIFNTSKGIRSEWQKATFQNINKNYLEGLTTLSEIAQLSKEDEIAMREKQNELKNIVKSMDLEIVALTEAGALDSERAKILVEARDTLMSQNVIASKFGSISKETKELYEELSDDLESINKTFKKVTTTAEVFFSSFKNGLGVALFAAGHLFEKFEDINSEIGGWFFQLGSFKAQAFLVSEILGEEAGKATISLGQKLGNVNDVTLATSLNAGFLAHNLGLSGDETANVIAQFGRLQGLSNDTALNTAAATKELAIQSGVAPKQVMQDIAKNGEAFALFSKDGGKNMAEAAVAAAKLGSDLGTASKMSENLLDYNNSIEKEMNASVLLGRDLNLSKARELAYAGDIAGAQKEALQAAGGIEEFNKMDYYQKKAVADALGVSVQELQTMGANMEKNNTLTGQLEGAFSSIGEGAEALAGTFGGVLLKGAGGFLVSVKGAKDQIKDMSEGANALKDSFGALKTFFKPNAEGGGIKNALKSFMGKGKGETPAAAATPNAGAEPNPENASKFGKINGAQLIQAAVALLIVAAALFVFAKAAQEFAGNIDWGNVFVGIAALTLLGGVAALLSLVGPAIIIGAAALAIAAGSFYIFGLAIQSFAAGMNLLTPSIGTLGTTMEGISSNLTALVVMIPQILLLAFAFTTLAAALAMLSVAGLSALPILAGLAIGGGFLMNLIGGGNGKKENSSDKLLEEIVGLRQDMNDGKIGVYIDGKKMNVALAISNKRQPS